MNRSPGEHGGLQDDSERVAGFDSAVFARIG